MSATVRLTVNTIIAGKWYNTGDPIEAKILPVKLRPYIAQPEPKVESEERNLLFHLNRPYSVDSEGYLRPPASQQAAQMEAAASEEEAIADELATEAELSPQVAAAIEQGRDAYRADLELQKAQTKVRAEHADAAADALRQEQDERVGSGEFDQWDAEARRDAKPTLETKRKSYVRRGGKFVPAASVKLVTGEKLYWFREKKLGQPAKYIGYGRVKTERKTDHVQTSPKIHQ